MWMTILTIPSVTRRTTPGAAGAKSRAGRRGWRRSGGCRTRGSP
jgi:hypothetical protein